VLTDAAAEANAPGLEGEPAPRDAAAEPERMGAELSDAALAHVDGDAAAPDPDVLEGLTRTQVRARRGPPTRVRGQSWIYTPEQPGCREAIVSEVVVFKGEIVASVRLERSRTNRICESFR
jgi:hypothetical protein